VGGDLQSLESASQAVFDAAAVTGAPVPVDGGFLAA
jgi:hypothetical protein